MPDEAKARESALRMLARRDHSSADLRGKLVRKGFSPQVVEEIIAALLEKGYLDDRRYAERWASSALAGGRYFGPRLRAELQKKGIEAVVASEVLAGLASEQDESHAVRTLVDRRFPGFDPQSSDDREKRRIFGFLQRRGFSVNAIMALFRGVSHEE